MDEQIQINKCLNCTQPSCTNCLGDYNKNGKYKKKPKEKKQYRGKYIYKGKEMLIRELAEIAQQSPRNICKRIDIGGVEFAMSGVRKYEDWKAMRGV